MWEGTPAGGARMHSEGHSCQLCSGQLCIIIYEVIITKIAKVKAELSRLIGGHTRMVEPTSTSAIFLCSHATSAQQCSHLRT